LDAARAAVPPEGRSQESGVRSQEAEAGGRKPEVRSQKSEAGSRKSEDGEQLSEEAGEDAEVAKPESNLTPETNAAPPPPDDDGYVWPEGSEVATGTAVSAAPEVANAPLPSLDELVKRIPTDVRDTYDDLFRGKFVMAKRVSRSSLKS
jgi:hypothetical protein